MKLVGWEFRISYGQQTFWYKVESVTDRVTERDFDNFRSVQNYLENVIITDPSIEKQFNSLIYGEREAELIELSKELDEAAYQYDTYEYWDGIGSNDSARLRNIVSISNDLNSGNFKPYLEQLSKMIEDNENTEDVKTYQSLMERIEKFAVKEQENELIYEEMECKNDMTTSLCDKYPVKQKHRAL